MRFILVRGALAVFVGALFVSCSETPLSPASNAVTRPQATVVTTPPVVISQIYGSGGFGGSPYLNDFVELFNPGTTPVDITGWSVQHASASSTSWSATNLSGSIPPGGYYLIKLASSLSPTDTLPTPDAVGITNINGSNGKVALVASTTRITSGTDCPSGVVDFVAFGTAAGGINCADPTGTSLTVTTAAIRLGDGCTYSGSNSADFTAGAPMPRNSASAAHACASAQPVVASVSIAPDTATILIGGTRAFTATARDAGNNLITTTFTWSSSNNAAATVDANGAATGVAKGVAFIVAMSPNGVADTAQLTVNALPPVAAIDGPYTGVEGTTSIAMSGGGSGDPNPNGTITGYAWTFGDGATGSGASVTHKYAQDGVFTVTLVVTNNSALSDTITTTATVSNVGPNIVFNGAALSPGDTYSASGSFTDPGADSWSATVNYGDGSGTSALSLNGKNFSLSHAYAAPGSFSVTVKVTDDDGTSTRTQTVVVLSLVQMIDSALAMVDQMVAAGTLKPQPYRNNLETARKLVLMNKPKNAAAPLQNLLLELGDQVRSAKLSAQYSDPLKTLVNTIVEAIM